MGEPRFRPTKTNQARCRTRGKNNTQIEIVLVEFPIGQPCGGRVSPAGVTALIGRRRISSAWHESTKCPSRSDHIVAITRRQQDTSTGVFRRY